MLRHQQSIATRPTKARIAVGFNLDIQVVKDQLKSLHDDGRNRHDVVHRLFEQHAKPDTEWRQQDDFFIHHITPETKLVRFQFDADVGASTGLTPAEVQKRIDERLRYVDKFMALMTGPMEEYHLTVEERPHINDPAAPNSVTYHIHGAVVPKGT